jgi:signal transduction histidine kinase
VTTTSGDPWSHHTPSTAARRPDTDKSVARQVWLLAVLPTGLLAVVWIALACVATFGHDGGWSGVAAPVRYGLVAGALLTLALLGLAGLPAAAKARAVARHANEMSRAAAASRAQLVGVATAAPTGDLAVRPSATPGAVAKDSDGAGYQEQVEVLVNLALRLQSLVHRGIEQLDELENNIEDPDLLKGVFQVDHLTTRVRRYAESLAVLGGAVAERQWTLPVRVTDVMRSAVAEVEQYSRVKVVPPVPGTVRGHAVADVVHLLAELAENATRYSPPQTRVLLRAETVSAGLAIEVEDRGLGMDTDLRNRMNALLRAPDRVILGELLRDGRIGLYVVSVLARRHRISVQLQRNIYGGTQAVLVLPHELLGERPEQPDRSPGVVAPATGPPPPPAVVDQLRLAATGHPVPNGDRPVLPTRRRQQHMVPQLREPARPAATTEEDAGHTPGLMAALQAGFLRADHIEDPPDAFPAPGTDTSGTAHPPPSPVRTRSQ